jgi:hypothetical protein
MTATAPTTWLELNQRYLTAGIAAIRALLEQHIVHMQGTEISDDSLRAAHDAMASIAAAMPAPPAVERVRTLFRLSSFEYHLLMLCAAVEFDAAIAPLCATVHGDPQSAYPTFCLGLATMPDAHWSALGPSAPLRHWRLLEMSGGQSLARSPLRVDERILHYLAGVQYLDTRLTRALEPIIPTEDLIPSHQVLADRLVAIWSNGEGHLPPAVQLFGADVESKWAVAAAACASLGITLARLPAQTLPSDPNELDTLIRLWERESILGSRALLLDCEDLDAADTARAHAIRTFIERTGGLLVVASREQRRTGTRQCRTFEVVRPSASEQEAAWHTVLGANASRLNGHVSTLISQFTLTPSAMRAAADAVQTDTEHADDIGVLLWDACRLQTRTALDDLAQRIDSNATWDDLVLPEAQRESLAEIAVHVRQRAQVYYSWGFAGKGERGLGISALFAGASGTGKTMAAEVLANDLRLDLFRIDLSAVVSKYIGETEKNLRRVFDAAEAGGAILLFDEADALFGKRSEVKDSHDRYANIEVGYLLQRMEAYRGLAILTTNFRSALDTAFLRRLRFVVQFPFPDAAQRAEIWRRIFPARTPTDGLDVERLARLNVAGGNIRNIALNAAFLAAEAGEPVRMAHLLQAAHSEYAKIEKPLTGAEVSDWV